MPRAAPRRTRTRPQTRAGVPLPVGTVTFLFTDIEGSTRLVQQLGPAGYQDILERHQAALRAAFRRHGGIERGTEGDSFFVVFAEAPAAVAAAAEAQRSLAAVDWPKNATVRARIGIHTGVGHLGGDDYVSVDVNRAARIAAAGHGGQVLVSDSTRALVERALPPGSRLDDLGEHHLKDIDQPERIHQLVLEDLPADFAPLRATPVRQGNIPDRATTFVGRRQELADLAGLLERTRLLTLTGPGGTGKTSLAIELARAAASSFNDGAWFVALDALTDPDHVAPAIATTLGLGSAGTRRPLDRVLDHLRDRSSLLVLDNFEQVLPAVTTVSELLNASPGLHVVVTSRSALHLAAEQEYPVQPLPLPDASATVDLATLEEVDAVRLFVDRARRSVPSFELTGTNAPSIAEICRRLDGLPLAIELAASRIKLLGPDDIASRLGDRLGLLTGGAADLPERQRTLRAAIDWSYRLLDPGPRRLFERLSVFAGGWTIEAADTVCNPERNLGTETIDGLSTLVDASLVYGSGGGSRRFALLETIREYAGDRLRESGDEEPTRRRHAEVCRDLATEAAPHIQGPDRRPWVQRLETEIDNLRTAFDWAIGAGEADLGLAIGSALWRFWQQTGLLREGRDYMDRLLALGGSPATRLEGLVAAGGIAYWQGDGSGARACYEEAYTLARQLGNRPAEFDGLDNLAYADMLDGDRASADARLRRARELADEIGDRHRTALADLALAALRLGQDDYDETIRRAQHALPVLREERDVLQVQYAIGLMGQAHLLKGDVDRAAALYVEAIGSPMGRDRPIAARRLLVGASLLASVGRTEEALRFWGAGLAIHDEMGVAPPLDMMHIDDVVETARAVVGEDRIDAALAAGRALTSDEALDELESLLAEWSS